jgi:hypothetical protein
VVVDKAIKAGRALLAGQGVLHFLLLPVQTAWGMAVRSVAPVLDTVARLAAAAAAVDRVQTRTVTRAHLAASTPYP